MPEIEKEIDTEVETATENDVANESTEFAPRTLAEQLEALTAEGPLVSLEEPNLDFIDGAASDIDDSVAMELILKSLKNENVENPMIVGEAEQLPMLGLDDDGLSLESLNLEVEDESEDSSENLEFIDNDKLISIVESLLFATDKPVSIATLKVLFKGSNIRTRDIQRALDGLASSYAASDRGVSLEEIHGGYQLRTKVDNTEYLKRLAKVRPFRLSGPALEVLAIAAYKQPITKTEVDQIRGVESGHLMRALMERGMVGFGEKSNLPGRPMTYVTTRKFLETFGLRNLKELPTLAEIDQLLPEGIGDDEEKETLSDVTDAMANQIGSTYSESEEELQDISESLKVIDTTSEFFEQEKIRQRVERDQIRAQDIRDRLTFGDAVEDKDRKWLARYEAKEEQMARAAEAGEATGPLIVEDAISEVSPETIVAGAAGAASGALADSLAQLSAENTASSETTDEDSEIEDSEIDELAGSPDYDMDETNDV